MHKFESDYHLTQALNHLEAVNKEMVDMPESDPRHKALATGLFGNEVLLVVDKVSYLRNVIRKVLSTEQGE